LKAQSSAWANGPGGTGFFLEESLRAPETPAGEKPSMAAKPGAHGLHAPLIVKKQAYLRILSLSMSPR
jgi:hypothetical protein